MYGGAGDDETNPSLAERFYSLESSHKKLQEQLNVLLQEKKTDNTDSDEKLMDSSGMGFHVPGVFYTGSPYRNVLNYMGHAVHVSRASTGEIIYW